MLSMARRCGCVRAQVVAVVERARRDQGFCLFKIYAAEATVSGEQPATPTSGLKFPARLQT
jgi:hypothetical protein